MRSTSAIALSLLLLSLGCGRLERDRPASDVERFVLRRDSVLVVGRDALEVWLPAGWRGERRWYELRARAPGVPMSYNNVVVRAAPYDPVRDTLSLELLRRRLIKQTATAPNTEVHEERRTQIAGLEAHEIEGHVLVPGTQQVLHAVQAALLTPNHHVVSVTLAAPDSLWDLLKPELERIRARMRLRHAAASDG
ncbi:MAG: hypothetical protein N2561_03235 [Bacteroidetes bacterium]|nr:hypothetical protein [Rhodothermia bacterium]MCS7155674.1 hypothetical protein [Bacteroidota bacterium]MCX7906533.1 hypothetical protein [Bacteroidota bacterium]MDW8137186.1 hypothetical protein [Bacteroidota bacterium]MDW8284944.1 hypothetical protein [Bacteroidota bacterium]